ncbi:MAG: dienelactone hydrolase [Sphingobacteriales bacterium]|nr:dienelactone hydrolase [Sphingobacteriales bacterium]
MKEITRADIKQGVFDLYDDYVHHRLTKKEFMQKLSTFEVDGITVSSLMNFIMPDYKGKIQVEADDHSLKSEYVTFQSQKGGGDIKALLSLPADIKEKLSGIIVVHENRGLNPHIEDVARRASLAGFISLAPDALTPLGGYPGNDDDGREMHSMRSTEEMLEDFIAAYEYLKNHKQCNGKVGVVGFCFGGTIANLMAVKIPDLAAAVPFYGGHPPAEEVPQINAPLLIHYAELDRSYNAGWPAYEAVLKASNKEYTTYIYPETNHGFHNDTTPRYDKAAADLAWGRTIDFFKKKLK